ncbi:MAG: acyl-CoA dehydrogenase family protein [Burkholderiaceae bacterium]
MDLDYSKDEQAFREEVRAWLSDNLPKTLQQKVLNNEGLTRDELLAWQKILAAKGWAAPSWPTEWGGTDWTAVQKFIFDEELGFAGAPPLPPFGLSMCGPVLIQFGSPEQKKRFLPRIYNAEDFWCQGYSEPGSGSDLASLKTRAERRGDKYIVNGQKIWTTLGHYADWIFCLVRTDSDSPKRQEGISFLLIDMKTPGITVRPLLLMGDRHEVNEVFFENVEVPAENLVHEEGKGWTVAKFLLGHERLGTGQIGVSRRNVALLKEFASLQPAGGGRPMIDDQRWRDRLARVEVELIALEITNLRFLDQMVRSGKPPGSEVSILKIKGTEIQQALTELAVDAIGPLAEEFQAVDGNTSLDTYKAWLTPRYANYRKASIYAGSNEIQRNILAKMVLGL